MLLDTMEVVADGVNTLTLTIPSANFALEGSINGHMAFFQPSATLINIPTPQAPPVEVKRESLYPRKLPNRRAGFQQCMHMEDGTKVHLGTGEFPDGSLGEIFIDSAKEGAFSKSMLNCFAIAISLGLQYGVPLKIYVDQFRHTMFEPKGEVSGSAVVAHATSILDAIFAELDFAYPQGKASKPSNTHAIKKS